jgi:hypothetical protein
MLGTPPVASVDAEEQGRAEADTRIGTIIGESQTVEVTRDRLLLLYNSFNKYEKVMAAPHLVNLVEDEQLPKLIPHLMNPLTPLEAQETFFNDLLNRQPQIGWPVLVDVIAQQKHPLGERAKELLTTIVGEDHGANIAAWKDALNKQMESQGIELNAPTADQAGTAPQQ